MYAPMTGQNHLGLITVSNGEILPSLSPGIIVQTAHPRYHSFYAFVLEEFWRRKLSPTRAALISFYRPCEFIYSVGCHLCQGEHHPGTAGIVGSDRTASLARQRLPEYDPGFEYIETPLGGLELYYRGVMWEMGLIVPGGRGIAVPLRSGEGAAAFPIDLPTPQGAALAEAFREAVKDTEYYKSYLGSRDLPVPLEVVEEFGQAACLCRLQDAGAPDHAPLLDLFLHHGKDPERRRDTFRLFLDLADKTDGHAVRQPDFRRLIYFGESGTASYSPRPDLGDIYERWRLYQAREYYAFALNTLWAYFCAWGIRSGGDVRPLLEEDFIAYCRGHLRLAEAAALLGVQSPELGMASAWEDLERWLLGLAGASGPGDFDRLTRLDAPVQEDALYQLAERNIASDSASLTGMIVLLAAVALRFGGPQLRIRPPWEIARMGKAGRLSFDGFLRDLDALRAHPGLTIEEVVRRLISRYMIAQHLRVARGKLPENTFRFERQDGGLRFHQLGNPVSFADSRFDSVSTHLHELGLCSGFSSTSHGLTPQGRQLLEEGDLP